MWQRKNCPFLLSSFPKLPNILESLPNHKKMRPSFEGTPSPSKWGQTLNLQQGEFYAMKKSKFTDSQITDALKRAEAALAAPEICWELGISTSTF